MKSDEIITRLDRIDAEAEGLGDADRCMVQAITMLARVTNEVNWNITNLRKLYVDIAEAIDGNARAVRNIQSDSFKDDYHDY